MAAGPDQVRGRFVSGSASLSAPDSVSGSGDFRASLWPLRIVLCPAFDSGSSFKTRLKPVLQTRHRRFGAFTAQSHMAIQVGTEGRQSALRV